jgi:hypothetical protein
VFDDIKQQLDEALNGLKVFQLATVERLVEQFDNPNHSHRMLVADEVGLGKTVVAKGVIARLLEKHLQMHSAELKPFRVTYICSNLALANENRQKLALFSGEQSKKWVKQPSFGRLVELAVEKKVQTEQLEAVIEVCTLTPTTSFTLTAGSGNCHERAIIAVLLSKLTPLSDYSEAITALLKTDQITREGRWYRAVKYIEDDFNVNGNVLNALNEFMTQSCVSKELKAHYSSYYHAARSLAVAWDIDGKESEELKHHYFLFRVEIRKLTARCCAASLEADLFILDEFQRFQALTDVSSDSEESLIAQQVFHSTHDSAGEAKTSKVLMLSATPFKAVTMLNEEDEENSHHQQLQYLLKFISKEDMDFIAKYEFSRDRLHREVLTLADPDNDHLSLNENTARDVERLLQTYICRTERGQINSDFEQLIDSKELICNDSLSIEEVKAYRAVETIRVRLAELTKGRFGAQLIDFTKSAPWCMSFLQGYAFKKQFLNHIDDTEIRSMFDRRRKTDQEFAWLSREDLKRYKLNVETDTPNAKVRKITQTVFEGSAENLLWTPPAKAYYPFEGVFKGSEDFSKTLLFSSWAVVPRVLSSLWSYESERRTLQGKGKKPLYYSNTKSSPLLRFEGKTTLNTWHLLYPCQRLLDCDLNASSFDELFAVTKERIQRMLKNLKSYENRDTSNNDWYLLAPILLDIKNGQSVHVDQWLETIETAASELDDGEERQKARKGRLAHISKIRDYIEQGEQLQLGQMPADLAEVLSYSAIANPALCAQRTINSLWVNDNNKRDVLEYTYRFADLTAKLFNHEYAKPIVNKNMRVELDVGNNKSPAWFKVLAYCSHGNFQSMLDEFCHLLATSGHNIEQAFEKLSSSMGIRSAGEHVHFREDVLKSTKEPSHVRCHFAVSMGTQQINNENGLQRVVNVRDAFNSPFRPFVLSSTSIGQEGLDFHWYCRRVVHWNLPSNPIDIEQREGRVNRFKSYVIRKRLAEVTGVEKSYGKDIWEDIFEQAIDSDSNSESGLEPFWFYSKGTTKIERIVPMYPMSKEVRKYQEILKILVLYRLAFGQPRQEELLGNLLQRDIKTPEEEAIVKRMMINLSPLSYSTINELEIV